MTEVGYLWRLVEQEVVRHGFYPEMPLFTEAKDRGLCAIHLSSGPGQGIFVDHGTIWLNNREIGASFVRKWVMEVPRDDARTRIFASDLSERFLVQVCYDVLNGRASTSSKYRIPMTWCIPEAEVIE